MTRGTHRSAFEINVILFSVATFYFRLFELAWLIYLTLVLLLQARWIAWSGTPSWSWFRTSRRWRPTSRVCPASGPSRPKTSSLFSSVCEAKPLRFTFCRMGNLSVVVPQNIVCELVHLFHRLKGRMWDHIAVPSFQRGEQTVHDRRRQPWNHPRLRRDVGLPLQGERVFAENEEDCMSVSSDDAAQVASQLRFATMNQQKEKTTDDACDQSTAHCTNNDFACFEIPCACCVRRRRSTQRWSWRMRCRT